MSKRAKINFSVQPFAANVSKIRSQLPEITQGMKCVYGKTYRMDCNTCRCGHRNSLMCTKMTCLSTMQSETIVTQQLGAKGVNKENVRKKKRKAKRNARKGSRKDIRPDKGNYETLPPSKACVPGKFYQDECKRCYCQSDRRPICSLANTCNKQNPAAAAAVKVLKPDDVRPPISDKEFENLPVLAHAAAPCVPGVTYKVECNACVCDEYQNLMCDKLLCISFADMHRAEAVKKSGLQCNRNNVQENEVLQSKCVKCICNSTTYCEAVEGCIAETEVMYRTYGSRRNGTRLTLDIEKENCSPDHVYTDNCNKCYCQNDQTLRCTQKTCLNYNQAVTLEKQQQYLQEHGL